MDTDLFLVSFPCMIPYYSGNCTQFIKKYFNWVAQLQAIYILIKGKIVVEIGAYWLFSMIIIYNCD